MPDSTSQHYVAPVETESISVDAVRISDKPATCGGTPGSTCVAVRCSGSRSRSRCSSSSWPCGRRCSPRRLPTTTVSSPTATAVRPRGTPSASPSRGADIYSRIVWGSQTSLAVGLIATVISSVLGLIMGALAGFYGGWLDGLLSRVGDIFFAIPYILAAVVRDDGVPRRSVGVDARVRHRGVRLGLDRACRSGGGAPRPSGRLRDGIAGARGSRSSRSC